MIDIITITEKKSDCIFYNEGFNYIFAYNRRIV
jgi:hypothetical protein